jgi:hypothetical protein
MRWLLRSSLAVAAAAVLVSGSARALVAPMKSPTQRAITADVVVVGKVTAIEKDTVEAAPFPGAPNKVAYKVAVVKIETPLAGANNLTHLKVGFVPQPPADRNPPPPGVVRPPIRRPGFGPVELKEGQEFLLFLAKHPESGFYVMPPMSPPVEVKDEAGKKEVEGVKKVLAILADPMKSLKAEKPADRSFAAVVVITRYRSNSDFARGEPAQVPIPAEESKLLLKALAEGDWSQIDRAGPNPVQAFYSLGLTEKDGWVQPQPPRPQPGQPPVNFNNLLKEAFVKWLDGPGKNYQIKKFVPKQK